MGLVKYGGGIIQISGSIAGNTFARNRFGNYIRARTKPTNPNTARQQEVRNIMAELTSRWSGILTANQREAWGLYGTNVNMLNRLGETIQLTGFNHYIRSNMIPLQWSLPPIDDGPVVFEIPACDPAFSITASEAGQSIGCTYDNTMDWANENGGFMFFSPGLPQNAQRNFFDGPWRRSGVATGDAVAAPVPPSGVASQWGIAEGQRIWCQARIRRADGRLSTPMRADCFCQA